MPSVFEIASPDVGASSASFGDQVPSSARLDPVVDRLQRLHPKLIDLSLDRLRRLLARLGNPEKQLPPVIHVAGTNGKGSTCAFLRAIVEAAGLSAHVYTSPHLVRFNERIRLAGNFVADDELADAIELVEHINAGDPITLFEVTTAVAFHLFARTKADACILEVGLGGRFDATNVVERPAACAIASISLDHREMLGDTIDAIAFEKSGIIKSGVPVVTGLQPVAAFDVIAAKAAICNAPLHGRGKAWRVEKLIDGMRYEDEHGSLDLPFPSLLGSHQTDNAGIAVAALRASGLAIPDHAYAGIAEARWPARLQRLHGRLAAHLPEEWELWLDGGHNPEAGDALAVHLEAWTDKPIHLIVGMKQAKDATEFLRPLLPLAQSCWAVAEDSQHFALPVEAIIAASGGIARSGPTIMGALRSLVADSTAGPQRVLICGTLYLAGEALKADGFLPC
jgi:dihydrofolate synthase/folylpolyglutamate synthase